MILKSLLEQEITKDVIEYKILYTAYVTKKDSNLETAIINKIYNLIYDAKLYVRIFDELDSEDKKVLIAELDSYFDRLDPLKSNRSFTIEAIDAIFWQLMNYLNAKTKEDFDRILAKVKNKER